MSRCAASASFSSRSGRFGREQYPQGPDPGQYASAFQSDTIAATARQSMSKNPSAGAFGGKAARDMPWSEKNAQREGGVFDALPWEWNASPLAKRDGYSRLGGRDFPQGSDPPPSSFHLLLEAVRRDACADVARVLLVDEPNPNRDGIVVGGCLVLERRLPAAGSAAGLRPRDAAPSRPEGSRRKPRPRRDASRGPRRGGAGARPKSARTRRIDRRRRAYRAPAPAPATPEARGGATSTRASPAFHE